MDELLDAIAALVSLVSPEKVQAVAVRVRRTEASKAAMALPSVVGTPLASTVVEQLAAAWKNTEIGSDELALMLLTASHVFTKAASEQSTELVWTGPTTAFVSARQTEQVLLEVINTAKKSLFISSFVAYNVTSIINALNAASERGVDISMLLELSQEHGGAINFNSIHKMKNLVPSMKLYVWKDKKDAFIGGRVHAKVAVADSYVCFISSANLTGYAMEKNMELGVLIRGDLIPSNIHLHFEALVSTKIIAQESF